MVGLPVPFFYLLNGRLLKGQVGCQTGAGLEAVVQIGDEAYVTDSFGELIWTSEGRYLRDHDPLMGYHHQVVEIEEVGEGRWFLAELRAWMLNSWKP